MKDFLPFEAVPQYPRNLCFLQGLSLVVLWPVSLVMLLLNMSHTWPLKSRLPSKLFKQQCFPEHSISLGVPSGQWEGQGPSSAHLVALGKSVLLWIPASS